MSRESNGVTTRSGHSHWDARGHLSRQREAGRGSERQELGKFLTVGKKGHLSGLPHVGQKLSKWTVLFVGGCRRVLKGGGKERTEGYNIFFIRYHLHLVYVSSIDTILLKNKQKKSRLSPAMKHIKNMTSASKEMKWGRKLYRPRDQRHPRFRPPTIRNKSWARIDNVIFCCRKGGWMNEWMNRPPEGRGGGG